MPLLNRLVSLTLPLLPKSLVGFFSHPYIAGASIQDAIRTVQELNASGVMATIDLLGESVSSRDEAMQMRDDIEEIFHVIEKYGLDSNVSIKPTQLGLIIDPALCEQSIRSLCGVAARYGNFLRIDMEDHPYTDFTLRMYRNLRMDFPSHVGTVIQAYLRRSERDVVDLMAEGPTNLRLCKGIYIEPEDIAFKGRGEVRANFHLLIRRMADAGAYPAIATHDGHVLDAAVSLIRERELRPDQYEFQMLLGVRRTLREALVAQGHRMRVYVPYGEQWYAYSVRRLKENPHMAMHIIKALFRLNR